MIADVPGARARVRASDREGASIADAIERAHLVIEPAALA